MHDLVLILFQMPLVKQVLGNRKGSYPRHEWSSPALAIPFGRMLKNPPRPLALERRARLRPLLSCCAGTPDPGWCSPETRSHHCPGRAAQGGANWYQHDAHPDPKWHANTLFTLLTKAPTCLLTFTRT